MEPVVRLWRRLSDGGTRRPLVVAAGGLLWRWAPEGLQCAIVFRRRYRGEPGLPKGKVLPGESLERAALREVREETGCDAVSLGYAGSLSYTYEGRDKVVFFWNMAVRQELAFRPSEEVERIAWLTPEQALETLVHPEEKNMLSTASPTIARAHADGAVDWLRRAAGKTWRSARYQRLDGSLRTAQIEIEQRMCSRLGPEADQDGSRRRQTLGWGDGSLKLLADAKSALGDGRLDEGWKLLHAARRMEILAFDARTEVPAAAAALRVESEKLKSWRQKAVQKLLGTPEQPREVGVADLYQAALIRDEHYDNQGYKDGLLRTQILWLAVILAAVMSALLGLIGAGRLPLDPAGAPNGFDTFVGVALFGLLGGTVSAMLRASDGSQSARIPELTAAGRVTFMRILMGSASAVVIYVFLASQLTKAFSQDVASLMGSLQPQTTYAVAFMAGFGERLVLRAVEQVAGQDKAEGKQQPG